MLCLDFDLLILFIPTKYRDVSVFQQLSSDKREFDSIWKHTLLGGSQISKQMEKHKSFQK